MRQKKIHKGHKSGEGRRNKEGKHDNDLKITIYNIQTWISCIEFKNLKKLYPKLQPSIQS